MRDFLNEKLKFAICYKVLEEIVCVWGFFCRTFDYNKKYLMMLTFIYLKNKLEGLRSVFLVIIRYQNQNPICIWKKWVHFEFPFFNFKYFQEKFVWISIHVKKEKKSLMIHMCFCSGKVCTTWFSNLYIKRFSYYFIFFNMQALVSL